jgi:hypothetical protein
MPRFAGAGGVGYRSGCGSRRPPRRPGLASFPRRGRCAGRGCRDAFGVVGGAASPVTVRHRSAARTRDGGGWVNRGARRSLPMCSTGARPWIWPAGTSRRSGARGSGSVGRGPESVPDPTSVASRHRLLRRARVVSADALLERVRTAERGHASTGGSVGDDGHRRSGELRSFACR